MIEQIIVPYGEYHLIARGSSLFLFDAARARLKAVPLPFICCECSWGFVAASLNCNTLLAVDIVEDRILHGSRDSDDGADGNWQFTLLGNPVSPPWRLRGVAFAFGSVWAIAVDGWFNERLVKCNIADDGALTCMAPSDDTALASYLAGYTAIFGTSDSLVTANLLGSVCWWDKNMRLVNHVAVAPGAVIGLAHDGRMLVYQEQENSYEILVLEEPARPRRVIAAGTKRFDRVRGICRDAEGRVILIDCEYRTFVSSSSPGAFVESPIDWTRAAADDVVARPSRGRPVG